MVLYKFGLDETKCMNCGICMDVCPFTCIEFVRSSDLLFYGKLSQPQLVKDNAKGKPEMQMMEMPYLPVQERCTGCQVCARECPTKAITIEPDTSKPSTLKPKPVILERKLQDYDGWHPLSEFTRDYLKRPVRSPWSKVAEWKPTTKEREVYQTWRNMEKNK